MKPKFIPLIAAIFAIYPMFAFSAEEISSTDSSFLQGLSDNCNRQLELGKLASEHASRADIRDFGKTLIAENKKIHEELQSLANNQGILVAIKPMPDKHSAEWNWMSKLSAEALDKSYLEQVFTDHEAAIKLLEQERKAGQNSKVKNFAAETLATERLHLERAESLQRGPAVPAPTQKTEFEQKPTGQDKTPPNAR